jgi:hypothetical protein
MITGLGRATVTCRGTVTIRLVSFTEANASSEGDITLDTGFECIIDVRGICNSRVRGRQGPFGRSASYTNNSRSLVTNPRGLEVTASNGFCPSGRDGEFNAQYSVQTPEGLRVTPS